MKIALYIIPGCGENPYVREVDIGTVMSYVRVSEIVEIDLPPLSKEIIHSAELLALEAKEKALIEEHTARIRLVQEARERLNGKG
jgi:hypothetical protein